MFYCCVRSLIRSHFCCGFCCCLLFSSLIHISSCLVWTRKRYCCTVIEKYFHCSVMTSKYEASVQHAMGSWNQALQPNSPVPCRSSLAIQRRELMDSVLSEKQGMILSLLAIQCTNRIMIYFTCTFTMDYPNESINKIHNITQRVAPL